VCVCGGERRGGRKEGEEEGERRERGGRREERSERKSDRLAFVFVCACVTKRIDLVIRTYAYAYAVMHKL
jgi:hypothetical protein